MKTNHKPTTIPSTVFAEAACKLFKCKPDEIDIRMIIENKEAFVIYQNHGYKVSTRQILKEDIESALTHKDEASCIHLGCWIDATKNRVDVKKVLSRLIESFEDAEEAKVLLLAAQLGSLCSDPDVGFWRALSRIDDTGEILGKAMVVTAQIYSGAGLIDDIADLQILNGKIVYNHFEGGIFETILIGDNDPEYPEFYIYSAEVSDKQ